MLSLLSKKSVEYHFLNVGQGDCSIITLPSGKVFMVDCHDPEDSNLENPKEYLMKLKPNLHNIDYLVITHPHKDHHSGLLSLKKYFWIGEIWDCGYRFKDDGKVDEQEYKNYKELLSELDKINTFIKYPKANKRIVLDSWTSVLILSPPPLTIFQGNKTDIHDYSLAFLLDIKGYKNVLFTGDISDSRWSQITKSYKNVLASTKILHASHHGSLEGAYLDALKIISPSPSFKKSVIISCGSGSSFPDNTAIQRYRNYFSDVRLTKNGTIVYKRLLRRDGIKV